MRLPKIGEVCEVYFKTDDWPQWWSFTIKQVSLDGDKVVAEVGGEEIEYNWEDLVKDVEFRFDSTKEEHSECHTDGKEEQRKLVILNAPKGCGKDVAAEHLVKMYNFHHIEFKAPVKKLVKSFYSLTEKEHEFLYRRENKEQSQDILNGKSIRDCYIHVSENVIKPMFGKEVFGNLLANSLQSGVSVASDGGFTEEVGAVAKEIGKDNILVVQIHSNGKSFEGDSRGYLYVNGVRTVSVNNLFDPQFFEDVECAVNSWLEDEL